LLKIKHAHEFLIDDFLQKKDFTLKVIRLQSKKSTSIKVWKNYVE